MFKTALRIAIAISILSATSFAFNQWNVNGTSCVADSGSINNQLYLGTGGTVKFAPGKTGDIVLYCAVSNPGIKPTLIGITYYDDSRVAGNHVTAQLIKMDLSTGLITPVVKVDSEEPERFRPMGRRPWCRMSLRRTTTSRTSRITSVSIS